LLKIEFDLKTASVIWPDMKGACPVAVVVYRKFSQSAILILEPYAFEVKKNDSFHQRVFNGLRIKELD